MHLKLNLVSHIFFLLLNVYLAVGYQDNAELQNIGLNFNNISGTGNGFELQYKPIVDEESTTAAPIRPSTPCGSIINLDVRRDESVEGRIFYKPDENYSANERCVWLIRSNIENLEVELEEADFETLRDKVFVDFFKYMGNGGNYQADPHLRTEFLTNISVGATEVANASVAIVTFVTSESSSGSGKGFVLRYSSNFQPGQDGLGYNLGDVINDASENTLIQPGESEFFIMTFYVLPPTNYQFNPGMKKEFNLSFNDIEDCIGPVGSCCDSLAVYHLTVNGLVSENKYCGDSILKSFESSDTLVLVYKTDHSEFSEGFSIDWISSNIEIKQ